MTPTFTTKVIGSFAVFIMLGIAGGAQGIHAMPMEFSAILNASQEVDPPGSTSNATGTAKLTLNAAKTELNYVVQINGLDLDGLQTQDMNDNLVGFHIHNAPAGENGPVVFGQINPAHDADLIINAGSGVISGIWSDVDAVPDGAAPLSGLIGELKAGNLYFNAHTPEFPPGAIRGQIEPVPEPSTIFLLGSGFMSLTIWRWKQLQGRKQDKDIQAN